MSLAKQDKSIGAVGEEEDRLWFGFWGGGPHGVMAGGMAAEHDFGAGRLFDAEAVRADGVVVGVFHRRGGYAPTAPPRPVFSSAIATLGLLKDWPWG